MSIITIIILGIIQGVTEFLPVSSSGHVLIFSRLLNDPSSFELDVLISFGTLFAVIWYYRKRFIQILKDIVRQRNFDFALKLAVATIPAVVCGFFVAGYHRAVFAWSGYRNGNATIYWDNYDNLR
jgi:undecaprenyl-diphosphatase